MRRNRWAKASKLPGKEEKLSGDGIISEGVIILDYAGFAFKIFSWKRSVSPLIAGWPDVWAAKDGTTYLIEVKAPGDRFLQSQVDFFQEVEPHLGENLKYVVAERVEDFERIANREVAVIDVPARHMKKLRKEAKA